MNRTDRLVAMVLFLQGRRVVKAEDLAQHFEINIRTVYRDMAALSEAGVPISGEAGVGYTLVKGYHLPPVMFSGEEALALFLGGEMVKHFGDASSRGPIETALLKLQAVLPREFQDEVRRLQETTSLEGCPQGPEGLDRRTLLPLQQAIVSRKVVRLQYQGLGDTAAVDRWVEPLGVTYYADAWYLVAWCRLRGAMRQFKLNRIKGYEVRDERFTPRPSFVLKEYLSAEMDRMERTPVRVWFASGVVDRARRERMVGFREETPVSGGLEVAMTTYSLAWMARWLLSFGTEALALEPEALVSEVAQQAEAIALSYRKLAADTSLLT